MKMKLMSKQSKSSQLIQDQQSFSREVEDIFKAIFNEF